jgi:hypothetical protein
MGIETLLHKAYNAEPRLEKMDLIKGGENNNNHNTTAIKSFAESDDDKIAMYTI